MKETQIENSGTSMLMLMILNLNDGKGGKLRLTAERPAKRLRSLEARRCVQRREGGGGGGRWQEVGVWVSAGGQRHPQVDKLLLQDTLILARVSLQVEFSLILSSSADS